MTARTRTSRLQENFLFSIICCLLPLLRGGKFQVILLVANKCSEKYGVCTRLHHPHRDDRMQNCIS